MPPALRLHYLLDRAELTARAALLLARGGPTAPVLRALHETGLRRLSPAEKHDFRRIEARRAHLARDPRPLEFTDYGKGAPSSTRSGEEMRRGVAARLTVSQLTRASKSPVWGCLLYKIIRHTGARNCLEMGTSLGISASYICAALPEGACFSTLEGAEPIAGIARQTLEALSLAHKAQLCIGPFHETLEKKLRETAPLDFAFVDGHHDGDATRQYFAALRPRMQPGGVMVFDDIRWSPGMRAAWKYISAQGNMACLDLGNTGIVTLL